MGSCSGGRDAVMDLELEEVDGEGGAEAGCLLRVAAMAGAGNGNRRLL